MLSRVWARLSSSASDRKLNLLLWKSCSEDRAKAHLSAGHSGYVCSSEESDCSNTVGLVTADGITPPAGL